MKQSPARAATHRRPASSASRVPSFPRLLRALLLLPAFLLPLSLPGAASAAGKGFVEPVKRILVFGDSNTYGYVRITDGVAGRLPLNVAWPGRMAELLGPGYEVVVEGLNGRTALTGKPYLPAALASHMPLDMVIIMLGTNDLLRGQDDSLQEIAGRLAELAAIAAGPEWRQGTVFPAPRVLMVCPPRLDLGPVLLVRSGSLAGALRPLAEEAGATVFDAATVVPFAKAADKIHLTPENHAVLAEAVARLVREAFGDAGD